MDKSDLTGELFARTDKPNPTVAERVARAASAFEQRLTGRAPESVAVVLVWENAGDYALSRAETVLAQSPAVAAQVQEFHRLATE
jgi:hypothetical protein